MLDRIKVLGAFFTLISFIFTGCSTKTILGYRPSIGSSISRVYRHVGSQKIKNSKAMHKATMRPYKIAGKWYYPTLAKVGDTQIGISSWYGPNFHAKKTSNGEIYNMYAMTAAHKTLPMNTILRVDNLENGKSAIVRINDRGPFVKSRIIDLSNKAAHRINMVRKGTAKVKITILGFNGKIARTQKQKTQTATVNRYFLQIGSFRKYNGAKTIKRKFEIALNSRYNVIIKKGIYLQKPINRVFIVGFRSQEEAKDFKTKNGLNTAMIIAQ